MKRLLFEVTLIVIALLAGYFIGYEHHGMVIDNIIAEMDAAEATSAAVSAKRL